MRVQLEPIHMALGFIEENLQNAISVGDIAASAGYSLYYFIRRFNQSVHHSPYDYLMRRRLSEAARELLATDRRILDIALDYCFHNHETFSRAFKRMFDVQPNQWRTNSTTHDCVLLPALTREYVAHINRRDFLPPSRTVLDGVSYVRFVHLGTDATLHLTLSYIYHTWLPQSGLLLAYPPAAGHFKRTGDTERRVALIRLNEDTGIS
jgi:AraC-like DNA-binding protein